MTIAAARRLPRSWFVATRHDTTMLFLEARSNGREYPLADGERRLGWFVLPPFQRPPVWSTVQQVKFIESCIMGLPIGVYVYNRTQKDGPYDSWLLDGQQRIHAIRLYMADWFPVFGFLYSQLTEADRRGWEMSTAFPCYETHLEDEEACRLIYERLAYGGTAHAIPDNWEPR